MEAPADERARSAHAPAWFYSYVPVNIANGATSPLIPLYMVVALHASVLDVGLVFFFTSLAAVPGAVFWGRLSDRLHRRRAFVIVGLASFAVTLPLMALTDSLAVYLAANAALGFLQAAGAATSSVLIMESSPEKAWAREIGRFAQVGGVAFVGGLALGALWFAAAPGVVGERAALEAMFFLGAGLSLASAVLGGLTIKEGHRRVDRAAAADALARLGHSIVEKRRVFLMRFHHIPTLTLRGALRAAQGSVGAYCLGIFLLFTGFLVFNAPLPVFLLNEAGFSQQLIFGVYLANSALAAALYLSAGRWCERVAPRTLLALAAGSRIFVYPAFAVGAALLGAGSPALLVALLALNAAAGASWAFINVASSVLAARLAAPSAKGEAMGLYNAAIGAGAIAGSLAGGLLAQHLSYALVFAVASATIAAGVLVVVRAAGGTGAPLFGGKPAARWRIGRPNPHEPTRDG